MQKSGMDLTEVISIITISIRAELGQLKNPDLLIFICDDGTPCSIHIAHNPAIFKIWASFAQY